MTRTRISRICILSAVSIAALSIFGCTSLGGAGDGPPPFDWDQTYATPGTSLVFVETDVPKPKSYMLKPAGFTADESLAIWMKRFSKYYRFSVVLGEDNLLHQEVTGAEEPYKFAIGGQDMSSGQRLDIALVSEATGKRAHASVFPHPIRAVGEGGCSMEIELQSDKARLFSITYEGFLPGEEVQWVSQYKDEILTETNTAPEGQVLVIMTYGRRDRGKATFTATSRNCTVSSDYNIGRDAK
jgi:hypothetical protein